MSAQGVLLEDDSALMEQVTVVIVTFNSAHCIEALATSLADCPNLVIVDNGSEDDTLALVAQRITRARVIALPENLGFGAANNRALEISHTPFALLLNPDCIVQTAELLALLRTARQWPAAAMVVPQITDVRGKPTLNYGWPRTRWKSRGPGAEGLVCVGNACGAVMLLRLDLLTPQDWFDPRFFLYYEDEDLCLRLFNKQLMVLLDPAVSVKHINRGSVRGRRPIYLEYLRGWHHAQSKIIFAQLHQGRTAAQRLWLGTLLVSMIHLLARIILPSPKYIARTWGRVLGLLSLPLHTG